MKASNAKIAVDILIQLATSSLFGACLSIAGVSWREPIFYVIMGLYGWFGIASVVLSEDLHNEKSS